MKNYYNIIDVSKNSSNNEIKDKTKQLIKDVKLLNISPEEKKIKLNELEEAYTFLNDYHKRKSLDDFLDNSSNFINLDNLSNPFNKFNSIFNNNKFVNDSDILDNKNSRTFYQSSSFTTIVNKSGNIVTEEKIMTNNNGDKNESHRIITKDKDGNETIKEIPKNKSKKSIKYNI